MEMGPLEKRVLASRPWGFLTRQLVVPWVLSFAELPSRGDVLELGGGGGHAARALAERFPDWRLTVTDLDPEMVERARARLAPLAGRVRVEPADATALPYADASFDLVLATFVWHHVGLWERATGEARRVLRPRGRLVLADLLASRLDPAGHGAYRLGELREALARAGFRRWRVRRGPGPWYRAVAEAP